MDLTPSINYPQGNVTLATSIISTTSHTIDTFSVNVIMYDLKKSAILQIDCYAGNKQVKHLTHTLIGNAFDAWGTDDQYIEDYVASNLYEIMGIPRPAV